LKICVLVHPGSLFTSGASLVDPIIMERVIEGVLEDVASADGLVVIDGFLSDAVPGHVEAEIRAALLRAVERGALAFRIWGCDAGERPFPGWEPFGDPPSPVCDGQEAAASAIASRLSVCADILVTGAWASRDGSSGCACSVVDALVEALPDARVAISGNALFEEYIEEDPEP
jgi:hypothetical protein